MSERDEFGTGVGTLLKITIAPTIWSFHFVLCYGAAAIWCEKIPPAGGMVVLQAGLVALTALALALIAASVLAGWRVWTEGGHGEDGAQPGLDDVESRQRFIGHAMVLLGTVSFIAVVFVTLPVLLAGGCR